MTDTQKRLEEFNELMDKLWDKYGESYEVYNPKEFAREIESFLATSIDQAIAEERVRVRGVMEDDSLVTFLQVQKKQSSLKKHYAEVEVQ